MSLLNIEGILITTLAKSTLNALGRIQDMLDTHLSQSRSEFNSQRKNVHRCPPVITVLLYSICDSLEALDSENCSAQNRN